MLGIVSNVSRACFNQIGKKIKNPHTPKESDSAPGGGHHGTIILNCVFSRDVVLQEQTFWVLLLQGIPFSCVLSLDKIHIFNEILSDYCETMLD